MNAHSTMEPDQETPTITVRDLRFHRDARPSRWWLNGDPVATAWHNALSLTFPRGEAFFIESVKACRDGAPPLLAEEIRAFVRQEVNHSREHLAFNRTVTDAGYDVSRIDAHVSEMLDMTKGRPAVVNLAATMALEHFTAIMAHEFLTQPRHFKGAEPEAEAMWRWHGCWPSAMWPSAWCSNASKCSSWCNNAVKPVSTPALNKPRATAPWPTRQRKPKA